MNASVAPSNVKLGEKYFPRSKEHYTYEWVVPVMEVKRYGTVLCRVANLGWIGSSLIPAEVLSRDYAVKPKPMVNK